MIDEPTKMKRKRKTDDAKPEPSSRTGYRVSRSPPAAPVPTPPAPSIGPRDRRLGLRRWGGGDAWRGRDGVRCGGRGSRLGEGSGGAWAGGIEEFVMLERYVSHLVLSSDKGRGEERREAYSSPISKSAHRPLLSHPESPRHIPPASAADPSW